MLIAIISLLQDQVQPTPRPSVVKIDRGGGGGARYPAFEITDYITAAQTFREIPNEHPVARAARRAEHIGRELEHIQRNRQTGEVAMVQGILLGAELQRRVQEEQDLHDRIEVEIARVRSEAMETSRVAHERGQDSGIGPALLVGGLLLGLALARRRR